MSNRKKTWFLVPSWDIPPSAIQLGNVIADPTSPQRTLVPITSASQQSDASVPAHPSPPKSALQDNRVFTIFDDCLNADVHTISTLNFSTSLSAGHSNSFSIFAEFLTVLGLGGKVSVRFSKENLQSYAFEKMETRWFTPTQAFAKSALEDDRAQGFLQVMGSRTPLYLITGIKTVWGVTASSTAKRGKGGDLGIGVNATGLGVPVSVGPELSHDRTKDEGTSWNCEGPIVFAYQIEQIRLKKGEFSNQQYLKGALFDANDRRNEETDVELHGEKLEGHDGRFEFRLAMNDTQEEELSIAIPQ